MEYEKFVYKLHIIRKKYVQIEYNMFSVERVSLHETARVSKCNNKFYFIW